MKDAEKGDIHGAMKRYAREAVDCLRENQPLVPVSSDFVQVETPAGSRDHISDAVSDDNLLAVLVSRKVQLDDTARHEALVQERYQLRVVPLKQSLKTKIRRRRAEEIGVRVCV